MKKSIITILITLILLGTLPLVGCKSTETRTNNFSVGSTPSVEVSVGNGNVTLITGVEGEIAVTAKLKNPEKIDYTISQLGDTIIVEVDTKSGSKADVTVTVPENAGFELTTGNGNVDVTGMQASGQVNSGNGSIQMQETDGDITGYVGNGSITLDNIEGSYNLGIGNGDIRLTGATGSFLLNTGNGDIRLTDAKGSVILSAGNGSISYKGELTPGTDSVISIGNGPVTVEMTGTPSVSLDLEIDSEGKVRCDLPVTVSVQSGHRLIGTIGDGEATLIVGTGSGNITIK